MNEYSSLSRLRVNILDLASQDDDDNTQLLQFLRNASRAIDKYTRRRFYPELRKGMKFDLPEDGRKLRFGRYDVLEVQGLSDINGASEIDSSVYNLRCGDDYNFTPYDRLEILTDTGSTFNFSGTDQAAIRVDAVLGYHEDYNNAWVDSGASLTAALNAGTSNILASVSGSAGMNAWGITPRFSTEQIWRLDAGNTSEEYVQVLDTAPEEGVAGSVIKLIRGINGTSAVAHSSGTTIEVWEPEPDIEEIARELAAWAYEKNKSPFTRTVSMPEFGVVEMPGSWPPDIQERLNRFMKRKVYATRF